MPTTPRTVADMTIEEAISLIPSIPEAEFIKPPPVIHSNVKNDPIPATPPILIAFALSSDILKIRANRDSLPIR